MYSLVRTPSHHVPSICDERINTVGYYATLMLPSMNFYIPKTVFDGGTAISSTSHITELNPFLILGRQLYKNRTHRALFNFISKGNSSLALIELKMISITNNSIQSSEKQLEWKASVWPESMITTNETWTGYQFSP